MEQTLKQIEVVYEPEREFRKYAIYRVFTNGIRQLWTVEMIERTAIRSAEFEAKKHKLKVVVLQSKRMVRHGY